MEGISSTQGGHQVAQKLTRVTAPSWSASRVSRPWVSRRLKSWGRGDRALHQPAQSRCHRGRGWRGCHRGRWTRGGGEQGGGIPELAGELSGGFGLRRVRAGLVEQVPVAHPGDEPHEGRRAPGPKGLQHWSHAPPQASEFRLQHQQGVMGGRRPQGRARAPRPRSGSDRTGWDRAARRPARRDGPGLAACHWRRPRSRGRAIRSWPMIRMRLGLCARAASSRAATLSPGGCAGARWSEAGRRRPAGQPAIPRSPPPAGPPGCGRKPGRSRSSS